MNPSAFDQLALRAAELKKPTEYYLTGHGVYPQELPRNILCFARRRPIELVREGVRFHHHRWILIVSLKGSGRVYINDHQTLLNEGDAVVIYPFQFHTYRDVDLSLNWLFISFELAEKRAMTHPQQSRKLGALDFEFLNECVRCWREEGQDHFCPLYLALLLERLEFIPENKTEDFVPDDDSALLVKVNQIILRRLQQPYVLKELASELGYSESHLRARFRKATGMSIGKHLRTLRMRHACRLLLSRDSTVSEIALACGFENIFTFSRAFRSVTNSSPTSYRRQYSET